MAARVSVRVAEDALTRDLPRVLGGYAETIARLPELVRLLEQRAFGTATAPRVAATTRE